MANLASVANNSPLLMRLYGTKVSETTYKRDKVLNLAKKDKKFGGSLREITVGIAGTAGGSASFDAALAAQNATEERTFNVRRRKEYQLYTIDNEAIQACMGDRAAIVEILKRQVGAAKRKFEESVARRTHGEGPLGRIKSGVATNTTTLIFRNKSDIVGTIEKNTLLQFAPNTGVQANPGNPRNGLAKVVTVNRSSSGNTNPSVTLNVQLDTITSNTDDYVFRYGDFGNAMLGLPAWNPDADPDNTTFYDVDRTEDLHKLSGGRWAGGGGLKEETLQNAGAECSQLGIEPTHAILNTLDARDLYKEVSGQKIQEGGTAVSGFKEFQLHLACGTVTIVATPYAKRGTFRLGNPTENLTLATAGECPMDLAQGTGGMLLLPTADAKQGRLGTYGNFWVEDTGQWLAGTF